MFYLTVREYERDGTYQDAELFCRLTKKMHDYVVERLDEAVNVEIDIKDSFYTVDRYYKGEQEYTKPTLILKDFEIL